MLGRISAVTISTPDLQASTSAYQRYLGYRVADDGAVGREAARAWGRPSLASARCVLMEPQSGADTYLRFVEGPAYPQYRPFAHLGWNAAELIVADVDRLAEELRGGPFHTIGAPADLSFSDQIRATQVVGPSGEVLYLTQIKSKLAAFDTPVAASFVDRVFIVIVGGASLDGLQDYYSAYHGLARAPAMPSVISVLSAAYGLPANHPHPIAALKVPGQCYIEADQMPAAATARPCLPGHTPPAIAMVTFDVARLPESLPALLGEPQRPAALPYAGRRTCTCLGAAGEWIELIEAG